ncbi:hypothetical protein KKF61_08465 [Patescibacteria group bacterium]|nr:hypothetical protein [Patescibacteria group bacterium]
MLKKIIEFEPAYDKRHADPAKNYGIHGVSVRFVLMGDEGATQFLLFSGWMLQNVHEEFYARMRDGDAHAGHVWAPMGVDVGYHSPKPLYEDQLEIADDCPYVQDGHCYYDGTSTGGDDLFWRFVAEGVGVVWAELLDWYNDRFGTAYTLADAVASDSPTVPTAEV